MSGDYIGIYGPDYREHCEFRERATAEVTGLTAARGKSFYPALTGQDSFRVLSVKGERERVRKNRNPYLNASGGEHMKGNASGIIARAMADWRHCGCVLTCQSCTIWSRWTYRRLESKIESNALWYVWSIEGNDTSRYKYFASGCSCIKEFIIQWTCVLNTVLFNTEDTLVSTTFRDSIRWGKNEIFIVKISENIKQSEKE